VSTPFEMPAWGPGEFLRAAMGGRRADSAEPPGSKGHRRGGRRRFDPSGSFPFGPGSFGDPRHWPGWEGRGPRARRGDVRTAALALLAEQPMNGYQIIQEIKQRSGGLWTPSSGSVYPALQQLEDEGLVQAGEHEGKRAFSLTEAGRRYVEEHREALQTPWESVAEGVASEAIGLRETFGRTFGAFMQVWHAGTDEQREQAARVLDETRKALYRILAEDDG
jgi:DNA-binding PadR family transcriptional regulator